jgi:hypothetical protein
MKKLILLLALCAAVGSAQAVRTNSGFGANTLANGDDNFTTSAIGFPINFFGQTYSSTFISANGNLTFGTINTVNNEAAWVPSSLRTLNIPMIAPFYADVDTNNTAPIRYGPDFVNGRRAFGVNYVGVGYFDAKADKLNSFQVVLIDRSDTGPGNFDIEFNYDNINWDIGDNTTIGRAYASVGYTNGLGGTQNNSFELPGSLTMNAFLNNGPFALTRQTRNSGGVLGRLVFEVRNGFINGTTLVIQPDNTIRNCPDLTIIARGTGFTSGSTFSTPQFQASLTENGQPRQITSFIATAVSGAPAGTYDFRVSYRSIPIVTDTGVNTSSNVSLSVTIPAGVETPAITATDAKAIRNCGVAVECGTLPTAGRVGFSVSGRANATAGIPPYVFRAPQGVPPGLAFALDGQMSGAPTTPGTFTYAIRVDDNSTSPVQFGLATCSITVTGTATPLTGACAAPAGTAGSAYSGAITASGGSGGYRFILSGGALPGGLALGTNGVISGTIGATQSGNYPFSVRINDSVGTAVVVNCSIQVTAVVVPLPSLTTFSPSAAVVGSQSFRLTIAGTNFAQSSVVVWNGFDLTTTFTNANSIIATIPANLLGAPGIAKIFVRNSTTVRSLDSDYEVLGALTVNAVSPAVRSTGQDTPVTIAGIGFFPEATVSLNGTRVTGIRDSSRAIRITIPAALLRDPGTITLRVDNPNGANTQFALPVAATFSVVPSISVTTPTVVTDQAVAVVNIAGAAAGAVFDGHLQITFTPNADNNPLNGANDFPRFAATSTRLVHFTLPAGQQQFRAPIDAGTVAGSVTVTLFELTAFNGVDFLLGSRPTQSFTIASAVPTILPGSVAMVRTATGFNVEVIAVSTRRSLTAGSLTFTLAGGVTNSGSATFPIDNLVALGNTWFQSDRGKTEGGAFKLTIPFTLEGDFNNLSSVQVTISNAAGASPPVSGTRR